MKDKALLNEVRKRVSMLEGKYETIARDLESARGFLAMLERDSANVSQSQGYRTHTDLVGDTVVDILSLHSDMHRKRILSNVLGRGIHIGNDDDPQKQLAGLSSILSRDTRFRPVEGKNGFWSLATTKDPELSESNEDEDKATHGSPLTLTPCPYEEEDGHILPGHRSKSIWGNLHDTTQKIEAYTRQSR